MANGLHCPVQGLPEGTPVVRVMPNTPALVGCGATVFARGRHAGEKEAQVAEKLFSAVGLCEEVDETMIDPVTALAGSGPAYVSQFFQCQKILRSSSNYEGSSTSSQVYMMIEALGDGGVKMGLPRALAYKLAAQTVLGAGAMVRETGTHPAQLKDDVASPAGSTITGIHHLEKHGLRSAVIGAVEAATLRCREFSSVAGEKN